MLKNLILMTLLASAGLALLPTRFSPHAAAAPVANIITITATGAPRPGETIIFDIYSLRDKGLPYQVATSTTSGLIRLQQRTVPLGLDEILILSVTNTLPDVFESYSGTLDDSGRGQARLHIPARAYLIGTRLHTAFLTLTPTINRTMQSTSQVCTFTVTG